jgi:hypothetical protein
MADPAPITLKQDRWSVDLAPAPGGPIVKFRGTISAGDPAPVLNRFVDRVNDALSSAACDRVRVDLTALEFVNSCGFKSFIYWVEQMKKLPVERQYAFEFVLDPTRRWQKTNVQVLTCFAPSAIRLAR